MQGPVQTWNAISRQWLTEKDNEFTYNYFLINISTNNGLELQMPTFHKELLESWYKYKNRNTIETKSNILNEILFGNKNISYINQQLFFKNWTATRLCHLDNIWDNTTNDWKTNHAIFERLIDKRNWIFEYTKIKASIREKMETSTKK